MSDVHLFTLLRNELTGFAQQQIGRDLMHAALQEYDEFKDYVAAYSGLGEELLHLHAGMAIFFLFALVFRRRLRSYVPIAAVYFFALFNEVVDFWQPDRPSGFLPYIIDILHTIFWPTMLFLLARRGGKLIRM